MRTCPTFSRRSFVISVAFAASFVAGGKLSLLRSEEEPSPTTLHGNLQALQASFDSINGYKKEVVGLIEDVSGETGHAGVLRVVKSVFNAPFGVLEAAKSFHENFSSKFVPEPTLDLRLNTKFPDVAFVYQK